jgi:tripartite-type tricarboxylate transporter receptor subunit TctC
MLALFGAGISFAMTAIAGAQGTNYPTQPIRMVVPFAPGGASDFAARLIQPGMSAFLGQQIVIENRAGAAGNIGMEVAARAAPDGYTVYLGNVGTVAVNPSLFDTLAIKPLKDFIPITLVADTPGILIAGPNFPPNNLKEMIDYVKARQGKINFASPGSGSLNRLEMEVFRRDAGLDMTHVPYKGGAGPAVNDLLGGHVEVMFVTISSALSNVKAGKLKAYAVTTRERVPSAPELPTMLELGWTNSVSSSWQGLFVPAGTPRPIVDKLYAAALHAMQDQSVRDRMIQGGVFPVTSKSPEEFRGYIEAETAKWGQVVKETGARPD